MIRWLVTFCISVVFGLAQTSYDPGKAPFTNSARLDAYVSVTTGVRSYTPGATIRWNGSHSSITVTAWDNSGNTTICLWQDKIMQGSCQAAPNDTSTSNFTWSSLDTGVHTWMTGNFNIYAKGDVSQPPGNWNNGITQITVSGGTGLVGAKPSAFTTFIAAIGDSAVENNAASSTNAIDMNWWKLTQLLGNAYEQQYGWAGWNFNTTYVAADSIANEVSTIMGNLPASPAILFFSKGTNDMVYQLASEVALGTGGPGCTAGTVLCDIYQMFATAFGGAHAPAQIMWEGSWPTAWQSGGTSMDTAEGAWLRTNIGGVITQWNTNNPTKPVCYIELTTAPGPVSDYLADNISDFGHPKPSGFTKFANWEAPMAYAHVNNTSSYTASCDSATATVGSPVTCTITLLGGGTYPTPAGYATAKMGHTFSDGARGGLWTPSTGGSAFASSGVVAPASGTTFTIKYTANAAGSTTLSFGNQQSCWIDPSPVQITVSSAATRIVGGAASGQ